MSRSGRAWACALLALTAGCAEISSRGRDGRREISVDAEGWAPIVDADTLSARRRALADAQKKAVEKAIGVTVRASTRVDDAVSVKQSIEANLGGTISRYEVASEETEGGFLKIHIRAVVVYQELKPDAPRKLAARLSLHIASERASAAVRSALSSRDYELSDDDAGADAAVSGVVETHGLSDPRLGGFYAYTVKVSLTAANLRTGKITRVDSEASVVDLDDHAACDRAMEKAGLDAGAALAAGLSEDASPPAAATPELSDARTGPSLAGVPPL